MMMMMMIDNWWWWLTIDDWMWTLLWISWIEWMNTWCLLLLLTHGKIWTCLLWFLFRFKFPKTTNRPRHPSNAWTTWLWPVEPSIQLLRKIGEGYHVQAYDSICNHLEASTNRHKRRIGSLSRVNLMNPCHHQFLMSNNCRTVAFWRDLSSAKTSNTSKTQEQNYHVPWFFVDRWVIIWIPGILREPPPWRFKNE